MKDTNENNISINIKYYVFNFKDLWNIIVFNVLDTMSLCYNDPEIYFLFPMIELLDG